MVMNLEQPISPDAKKVKSFQEEHQLIELRRAIHYGLVRCLSVREIIDKICSIDVENDSIDYIKRLQEFTLSDSDFHYLADAMNALATRSEKANSRLKIKIDRVILRCVRLLPSELAAHFAEPYINHRRKARREWAYTALREKRISPEIAIKLREAFSERGDENALRLIARNPERVTEIGADFLMTNITEPYWRTRIIQALITYDRPKALALSREYPFEFAHAAGRSGDRSVLDSLRALFDANSHNPEFLSIYAYALGKLACREGLELLEGFVNEKWPEELRSKGSP
jgi:hypothetical protein